MRGGHSISHYLNKFCAVHKNAAACEGASILTGEIVVEPVRIENPPVEEAVRS